MFHEAAGGFSHFGAACPNCGAIGLLSGHGDYCRYLTSFENGEVIDYLVRPERFLCNSCNTSHALLPDIVVPYCKYSLLFVLAALIAYFERTETVAETCDRFGISVSTIYAWKKRIAAHKDLMLGALISRKTPALAFLSDLTGGAGLSDALRMFFCEYGFSFMQNRRAAATRSRPP